MLADASLLLSRHPTQNADVNAGTGPNRNIPQPPHLVGFLRARGVGPSKHIQYLYSMHGSILQPVALVALFLARRPLAARTSVRAFAAPTKKFDSYQTVSVKCQKCGDLLFRCKYALQNLRNLLC